MDKYFPGDQSHCKSMKTDIDFKFTNLFFQKTNQLQEGCRSILTWKQMITLELLLMNHLIQTYDIKVRNLYEDNKSLLSIIFI